jgi:polar amino acid transport system substrate-binding protein
MRTAHRLRIGAVTVAVLAVTAVAACSDPSVNEPASPANSAGGASAAASLTEDTALHNRLPANVISAGKLTVASFNAQPPWTVPSADPNKFTGATADIATALQTLLGVQLQRQALPGLPEILAGISAKRYDFALGPVGDSAASEKQVDVVDWVKEKVVFAVPNGNPKKLQTLDDACGLKVGVIAGGSAETVLQNQTTKCKAAGKPAITIQDFAQQPQAILSVQSGRSDAYFSSEALLTYYVQQSKGALSLALTSQDNGFPNFYQGAVFPKDATQLRDVILDAFKELKTKGVYDAILNKYGLTYSIIDNFGVNLVGGGS